MKRHMQTFLFLTLNSIARMCTLYIKHVQIKVVAIKAGIEHIRNTIKCEIKITNESH